MGPFTLEPGKTGSHKIRLPQYTGSVRVMVTAAGEGNTFGSAEKSVIVSDPLMILATAPRVLSPGDRVALPVTVFAQKKEISEVNVSATGNEMITFTQPSGTVRFSEPGEKDMELLFTTAQQPGKAVMKVTASGGGETASYDMEVEVRIPNPPDRRSETKTIAPGEKYLEELRPLRHRRHLIGHSRDILPAVSQPEPPPGMAHLVPARLHRTDHLGSFPADLPA